jgi:hypothetical protein
MIEELEPQEKSAMAKAALAECRRQLFKARIDLALNHGNVQGTMELTKLIAQLQRGMANVEKEFAADLAYVTPAPAEKEKAPDA